MRPARNVFPALRASAKRLYLLVVALLCMSTFLSTLLSTPAAMGQGIRKKRFALVFTVDTFPGAPSLAPLEYATRDGARLFEVLSDPQLGRFDEVLLFAAPEDLERVRQRSAADAALLSRIPDKQVRASTRQAFLTELDSIIRRSDENAAIVIYFATHGMVLGETTALRRIPPERTVFATRDTTFTQGRITPGSYLTELEVLERLERSRAVHRLLIEATCHTPRADLTARGAGIPRTWRDNTRRTLIIGDSSPGQRSYELDQLEASIFTEHLIEALRAPGEYPLGSRGLQEFDPDLDGAITVEEAYEWAADQTWNTSCQKAECQAPFLIDETFFRREPFVLSGNLEPVPPRVALVVAPRKRSGSARSGVGSRDTVISVDGESIGGEAVSERLANVPATTPAEAPQNRLSHTLSPGVHRISLGMVETPPEGSHSQLSTPPRRIAEQRIRLLVRKGEQVRPGQILRRLEADRSLAIQLGAVTWLEPETPFTGAALQLSSTNTLLTTARDDWSLETGARGLLSAGSACLGSRECPVVLGTTSWMAQLEGLIQLRLNRVFPRASRIELGVHGGPLYLSYFGLDYPGGGLSKLALTWGPHIGIGWRPRLLVFWQPTSGGSQLLETGWLHLSASADLLQGILTPGEVWDQESSRHVLGRVLLGWQSQF